MQSAQLLNYGLFCTTILPLHVVRISSLTFTLSTSGSQTTNLFFPPVEIIYSAQIHTDGDRTGEDSQRARGQRTSEQSLHVHRLQEAATKTTAYVKTSLSFVGSFGGHISRYAHEWSHLTLDPWVLSTLSQGFRLEFVDDSVQSFGQPNTIRNNKDTQLRTQLRNKCPIFSL